MSRLLPASVPLAVAALLCSGAGLAADPAVDDLATVLVTGTKLRALDLEAVTASRLGLSARETPATVDSIDAGQMLSRGYVTIEQAAVSLPGVGVGGSAGDLLDFSMRGFTGQQISMLTNGLNLGPSNMTNRPANTFNLERLEVLKGPASVLYGQGAIGGVINQVTRRARFGESQVDALASFGSFGSTSLGLGAGGELGEGIALRVDLSRASSDGYVKDAGSDSLSLTSSARFRLGQGTELLLSFDYLEDHPAAYFGTPLVTAAFATQPLQGAIEGPDVAIDRRMRFVNYNVADNRVSSRQLWPQLQFESALSESVKLTNLAYYFDASRSWINAEVYAFNASTQRIDRDRFFVLHDQQLYGDQLSLAVDGRLAGRANRLVLGADFSHLDFVRGRGFPDGDSVDPFNPVRGSFGPLVQRLSPTQWNRYAVFVEDVLSLTGATRIVAGARFESLALDRKNFNVDGSFNAGSSFKRDLDGLNWRLGVVHDVSPGLTAYASYNTGQDPVGSNIFLVNAGQDFSLSDAYQVEAGLKYSDAAARVDLTAAVYSIERRNILTQINSAGDLSNLGSQRSRGFELSGNWQPVGGWTLSGSLTYTDAKYGRFFDPDFGIEASGNTPANVPRWTGRAWTAWMKPGGLPLELGGGASYVGSREANSANTLRMQSYVTADAYASWHWGTGITATARVTNLFDKAYAQWADIFYPTELILGSPRRVELQVVARF